MDSNINVKLFGSYRETSFGYFKRYCKIMEINILLYLLELTVTNYSSIYYFFFKYINLVKYFLINYWCRHSLTYTYKELSFQWHLFTVWRRGASCICWTAYLQLCRLKTVTNKFNITLLVKTEKRKEKRRF